MFGNGHIESGDSKSFYRIGEVSRLTDTKTFVLRYWETEFPMLQPVKSPKGHRLYRREDVDTVLRIQRLLYDEGFTIAGARRHLREEGESSSAPAEASMEAHATEDRTTEARPMEDSAMGDDPFEPHVGTETHAETEYNVPLEGASVMEAWLAAEDAPPAQDRIVAERRSAPPEAPATIGRNVLLDLRDSLSILDASRKRVIRWL